MIKMTSSTILVALLLTVVLQGREINKDDLIDLGGDDVTSPSAPMSLYAQLNYAAAMVVIKQINSHNDTFVVAPNQFAAMSQDEKHQVLGLIARQPNLSMKVSSTAISPQGYDPEQARVAAGANTMTYNISWMNESLPVRNQGMCGSCWAFTGVVLVEQAEIRLNKTRFFLSPQNVMNCNSDHFGCNGGYIQSVLYYANQTGITRESYYPYKAMDQPCKILPKGTPLYKIKSFTDLKSRDCKAMISALANKVVGVAVAADDNFVYYSSGVLTKCGTSINHAVVLTGYVSNATDNYYVIKNSWSTGWGEKGYMRISSTVQSGNLCGICTYPVIANF